MDRLFSRKLWVTLATLAAATWSAAAGLPWWAIVAQACAGVAYVLAQAWIDASDAGAALDVAEQVIEHLRTGLERAEDIAPAATPGDVGALEPPRLAAAVNPAIVLALISLAQTIVGLFRRRRR